MKIDIFLEQHWIQRKFRATNCLKHQSLENQEN